MKIAIKEKNKPFSHVAGAKCIIPGTYVEIEAFPTLLKIGSHEVELPVTGPVEGFTLELDLERHSVFVFGQSEEGFFKLKINASDAGIDLIAERGKLKSIRLKEEIEFEKAKEREKLFLGSHKAQEWEKIHHDLASALPILFALGQCGPEIRKQKLGGAGELLEMPKERMQLAGALKALLKAAFTKILVPRLTDDQHQGLVKSKPGGNRFFLLQEASQVIRSLFFVQNERRLAFLPHLPVPLHCGKMTGVQAPGIGTIDFEWSKKLLRQLVIHATTSGEIVLELQKELKTFRVNKRRLENQPILIEAGKTYYFDNFQK